MKREYPAAPIVTVGLVVRRGDRVLIVQRGNQPNRGRWSIPGGAVEIGEPLREAGRRELREECGIEVTVGEVAGAFDAIMRDEQGRVCYHYVIVDFHAEYRSGELHPSSDILDARWVGRDELEEFDLTETARDLLIEVLRR